MEQYRFCVAGRMPGLNEMIEAAKGTGGRGIRYSKMKSQWTLACGLAAKARRIPRLERVFLHFNWIEPKPSRLTRERDPDNIAAARKFVLDGLVDAGVIDNDKMKQIAGWRDDFCVGLCPGVEVTLTEVEA